MSESFQDVYAKNLQHAVYGYPLRMPEPMSTLPQNYQENGLQIGDVGIVDSRGQFDVLFNICKRRDNELHDPHGVPRDFEPIPQGDIKLSENAISPGPIHSHGIKQVLQPHKPRSADYEFDFCSPTGAILILPNGAASIELSSPEKFRQAATESALDWYEFAKKRYGVQHLDRSLYLITGFYKAGSWSLGSFNSPTDATGKILARRDDNNPKIYLLEFTSPADRRHSSGDDSGSQNQTVFVTGFKISIGSWLADPVVLRVTESETTWSILVRLFKACLNRLRGDLGVYKQRAPISVEHSPQLSQPFHPSDIINRFMLDKNPNAKIAITHDNQWMGMMKEGLTQADLLQEDRLEAFLTRCYAISSEHENTTVFLQSKSDNSSDSRIVDPPDSSRDLDASDPPTPDLEPLPPPRPSHNEPRLLITHIRAQNIPSVITRLPAGFYVLVQIGSAKRITKNKPILLNDRVIEWKDEILLPSNVSDKVRFTVYASFELEPTLGNGEALCTSESHAGDLVGGTHLITFSNPVEDLKAAAPDPSLLITLARWHSDRLAATPRGEDCNVNSEDSSDLAHETNLGHEALLRYHHDFQTEDLEHAIQHFTQAWHHCPPTHRCRSVVVFNLARVKSTKHWTNPAHGNLDEPISLCRQVLDLRPRGSPDRPATLLQLAQTLLFRYEKQGCHEPVADEINVLMSELRVYSEESHERRAADLVLETLERCKVVDSGSVSALDELVQKLEISANLPSDGHFDKPQRLINLSSTLWRRYEKTGELGELERSMKINNHALQLLPSRHPDRLSCLRTLGAALWKLFEMRGDLGDIRKLVALNEEALQLVPDGHPERGYWVTNSTMHLVVMSESLGDIAFESEKYDEAVAKYSHAITLLEGSPKETCSPQHDIA